MALAREMVELHHGFIDVESAPGGGSEFCVLLPRGRAHLADEDIIQETITGAIFEPSPEFFYGLVYRKILCL